MNLSDEDSLALLRMPRLSDPTKMASAEFEIEPEKGELA
jgi:hypothetical protein